MKHSGQCAAGPLGFILSSERIMQGRRSSYSGIIRSKLFLLINRLTCFIETYLALSRLSPTITTANPGTVLCFDLIRSTSRRT